jgi:hypothetical protein
MLEMLKGEDFFFGMSLQICYILWITFLSVVLRMQGMVSCS